MIVEMLRITPEMATRFLQTNDKNRNLSDRLVQKYAQDMKNGNWTTTHQGIAFYEDGTLADGQHRLVGITRANIPVTMYVTYGLPKHTAMNIDMSRPRSMIDGIKISGTSDWIEHKHIAMIKLMVEPKRMGSHEIVELLNMFDESAKFAVKSFPTNRRYLTNSVIHAGLCIAHYHGESEKKLRNFAEVLLSGVPENSNEKVIILLRESFLRNPNNGSSDKRDKLYKTERAIYAFCHNESIGRLMQPKEPTYSTEGLF